MLLYNIDLGRNWRVLHTCCLGIIRNIVSNFASAFLNCSSEVLKSQIPSLYKPLAFANAPWRRAFEDASLVVCINL